MALRDEFDALDAWLSGEAPLPTTPDRDDPPGWSCTLEGAGQADMILRRLARIARNRAEVQQVYDTERARLEAYRDDRMAGLDRMSTWLADGIEGYMRARFEETGSKTLTLPTGVLRLRDGQPSVIADDTIAEVGAARHLAEVSPEYVRANYDLDRNAIKEACQPGPRIEDPDFDVPDGTDAYEAVNTTTGEVVPGVVFIVPGRPKFSYQVTTGADT